MKSNIKNKVETKETQELKIGESKISLNSNGHITIGNNAAQLEISPEGNISIQGKNINQKEVDCKTKTSK